MARVRRSPGGVGDGLPATPSGEPLLARWFAAAMVVLVVVGVGVTIWAALSIRTTDLEPAARRPPGTTAETHLRGQAALGEDRTEETGVACVPDVRLVGDEGARRAAARALSTACQLLDRDEQGGGLEPAGAGLELLDDVGGAIGFALFESTGLDSSTRLVDGVPFVELNPKFQFENSTLAAPFLLHELAHLGAMDWPEQAVDVADELRALEVQARACDLLVLPDDPPRGCRDAEEVLADPDPEAALERAGYEHGDEHGDE